MSRMLIAPLFLSLLAFACGSKEEAGPVIIQPKPQVIVDKGWTFESTPVWSDEFDYTGAPNATKWGYDVGGSGWGNNELQFYTTDTSNAVVRGGNLIITARKEDREGKRFTSARLISREKGDILYGRIEARAKLPAPGKGSWPAIWMLPTDWAYGAWPKSGEIDIMEHVGYDQNKVHFSVHTESYNHVKGTQRTATRVIPGVSDNFHKYRVDWTPYAVRGFFDDVRVFEFVNEGKGFAVWPFDKRFHMLLNLAVGGNWGGAQGMDESIYPISMEVDYVRFYKMIEQ